MAVDKGLTGGRFHLLIAAVCPHLPGIDVIPQLQLQDIAQLLDEDRILHPDTHLHAALGVAGEEIAGGDIDAGGHAIVEAVDAAMLKVAAHQTADMQVLGLARHLGADTTDAAHDHIDADSRTAGFFEFQDDIPIRDGVVFQDHGCRAAQLGCIDDPVHLVQQHALEAQRGHQHLLGGLRQLLHGKVLEHVGGFLTDAQICRDERIIGIELAGLFVVVAGADLGDVAVALRALLGDEGQLGVHLVIIKAIEDSTASLFQLLGPVDVILLVKAGTQLYQSHHFLAIFGGFDQGLHDLGFPRHPVKGHLNGDDLRIPRGLFQHRDEGTDRLIRITEQDIVLFHLGGKVIILGRQHGPGRGIEQLRVALGLHLTGELVEEAQIQWALLGKHPLMAQF